MPDTAPEEDLDGAWDLTVRRYRGGLWAVQRSSGRYLSAAGVWSAHARAEDFADPAWRAAHLFDVEAALRLAREAAPDVSVNGVKARDLR